MLKKTVVLRGFLTGLVLQLAIGPVFLVVANIAIEFGRIHGFFASAGVIIVDYMYIVLAILGVGKLLEASKYKSIFANISSVILILFGFVLIRKGFAFNLNNMEVEHLTVLQSFGITFFLTLSSPLTIIFWTSIFANKSIEYSLRNTELIYFGLAAGFATVSFLGIAVILLSLFNNIIPDIVIKILNIIVGFILVLYGLKRILKVNSGSV